MRVPILTDLLDLFFPRECPACEEFLRDEDLMTGSLVCQVCLSRLAGLRLPPEAVRVLDLPVLSAWTYADPLDRIIPVAKAKNQPRLFDHLAGGMVAVLREAGLQDYPRLIVPVPLHPSRRRERGFDQAFRLACSVGGKIGVPVARRGLRRIRSTPPQKLESRERRLEILHDAFSPGYDTARITGERVLLIDDVVTTGATLAAAVRALQQASPAGVLCLTAARTA